MMKEILTEEKVKQRWKQMETDGRNECDLGSPYRETERLSGWLYEYSYCPGWGKPEESRIKKEGQG